MFKEREHRPQFLIEEASTSHCKTSRWDGRHHCGQFCKMPAANEAVRGNAKKKGDYPTSSVTLLSESVF